MADPDEPNFPTVEDAMRAYKNGNERAFGAIYASLSERLLGFLRKQTRDEARAEDILQETFLKIHRARARYIDGAPVIPWAFAIARRLYIDCYRRERRGPHADLTPDPDALAAELAVHPNDHPDSQLEGRQMIERIAAALDRLPTAQRVALVLVVDEEFNRCEAAEILGITEMSLRLRLWRARRALRRELGIEIPQLGSEDDESDPDRGEDPR